MAEEQKPKQIPGQQTSNVNSGFSVPERIWNFLCKEKNIGSITTAAIMGNIAQESNYNTKADSSAFDGNASIGLCQWTFGRKTALINFAQSQGKNVSDVDVQLNFLWQELGQRGDINKTKNASKGMPETDKNQIYAKIKIETKAFCDCFEIPDPKYANYENRYNRAIEAYEKQGKGVLSAGNYTPENTPGAGFLGQPSAAKRGTTQDRIGVEKVGHTDEWLVKPLDPDKTFCEPIYPDLTTIGKEIPSYAIPSNIPTADMNPVNYDKAGAGLVYSIPTETIVKYSGNTDLAAFAIFNEETAKQRQQVFNVNAHRNAIKIPTGGKPPNNKDPFPVDQKIVELETHQPRCKIDTLKACHHSIEAAKAVVLLSTDTEKRLVRLENNMATLMRYLYRMASRVNINCVYYGGQIPSSYPVTKEQNNKYCCIRCLKDDRIQEGKQVSLDQCLNCTRYEPLIGQIYDIYNDFGINLSQVLDDNQMSYSTMDEYCKFIRASERQTPMEAGDMDAANVQTRNASEIDLDDEWGPGLAMNWSLYPVEMQQPHTEPPTEGVLASSYGMNNGMAITNSGITANMLIEARNQIDSSDSKAKEEGSNFAQSKTDYVVSEVKAKLGSQIREVYRSKQIKTGQDQCLIASLMAVYGGTVENTIDKLEKVKNEVKGKGVDNIVLHVMFYALDQKYLFGDGKEDALPVRLDKIQSKTSVPSSSEETGTVNTMMPANAWSNVSKWNWNDISIPLSINITENYNAKNLPDAMINFAKVVYLYKELVSKCSASRFDTAEWGFPFIEEEIAGDYLLNFSSPFGPRNIPESHNTYHYGVDFGVGSGADSGNPGAIRGCPVHAVRDGIVYDIATFADNDYGGQQIYLQHEGGYTSWYMHLSKLAVNKNDKVTRGQIIGYTGGSGPNNNMAYYAEHLHFEIHQGGDAKGNRVDPLQFYHGITNADKGSQLSALSR